MNINNSMQFKAEVRAIIEPIAQKITQIMFIQANNANLTQYNENPQIKMDKRSCVHWLLDQNGRDLVPGYEPDPKDPKGEYLVCKGCGRRGYAVFDETATNKVLGSLDVINMAVFMGPLYGLPANDLKLLIDLKNALPYVATIVANLNDKVAKDNKNSEIVSSIANEYERLQRITNY